MKYKNNPFNIRHSRHNRWQYELEQKNGFCQFSTLYAGIRAAVSILCTYINKYGINTIDGIIYRWAPPSENSTELYIDYVKSRFKNAGVEWNIHDHLSWFTLLDAMYRVEQGCEPSPEIHEYYKLALIFKNL